MQDTLPTSDRPIRVLHLIARLNVGGAALHVMLLASHLSPPDFESRIVCGVVSPDEADMGYVAAKKGVPVTIIKELGRELSLRGDLRTLYLLWRLIRREQPDVVHTNTAKAGFVGRIAARLAGVPVVTHTFHGHVFSGYFSPRKTQFFILLERLSARLADRIIAPSAELKRQLVEQYHICPADQISVIEVGLDLEPLTKVKDQTTLSDFRAQHNIPANAPLVGVVGRLVPIKNHDLFLQAAAQVHAQRPAVHFVLVGDGERRAELTALTKSLGLAECVTFAGWATDVLPVYRALDVLVLSSRNEGMPISVIEAMAAGVPVVSTCVGGVPDLIPEPRFGALVPPDDPKAMTVAILRALDGTGYDLVGAREFVLGVYDMKRLAERTGALYRELLAKKRR